MSRQRTRSRVITLAETASTNTEATARALAGEPLPLWVTAERQTAGRGRSGRTWESQTGNLHASLAITLSCDQQRAAQLSLVAGVAMIEALRALAAGTRDTNIGSIRLKWPNDILAGDAKLGGILIETTCDFRRSGLIAVIGFGLNVVSCPPLGRKLTHLLDEGFQVSAGSVQVALADTMEDVLVTWSEGEQFSRVRERWLEAGMAEGTGMTIHAGDVVATGSFAGLDADGALLLRDTTGRIQRFTFGDVALASDCAG